MWWRVALAVPKAVSRRRLFPAARRKSRLGVQRLSRPRPGLPVPPAGGRGTLTRRWQRVSSCPERDGRGGLPAGAPRLQKGAAGTRTIGLATLDGGAEHLSKGARAHPAGAVCNPNLTRARRASFAGPVASFAPVPEASYARPAGRTWRSMEKRSIHFGRRSRPERRNW